MAVPDAEQPELLKTAKTISSLIPKKYADSHHMRALIAGFYALSLIKELPSVRRLLLIKSLFTPNLRHVRAEQSIQVLCVSLRGQSVQSGALQPQLTLLLGRWSVTVLGHFSKYFPRESKALTPKELKSLFRGVLEKFNQVEHERAFQMQLSNWFLVEGLSLLGEISALSEKKPAQYKQALYKIFQDIFNLSDWQMRFYKKTFANQRNEAALLTYLAKLRTLLTTES
jgi:hypothetical protein